MAGWNLQKVNPLPATEGYLGFIFNRINFINPISYLGYLYHLEFMAVVLGPEVAAMIMKSAKVNEKNLAFLKVHAQEDKDHIAELSVLVDQNVFASEDAQEVLYTARTAAALFCLMIDSAFKNPWRLHA